MASGLSWRDARALLGDDLLGPDEVGAAFDIPGDAAVPPVPFSREQLSAAQGLGEMLVLRVAESPASGPLTIMKLVERIPQAFDPKLLRQVGYQLKDEWGIALEPLASSETARPGWALVRKEILDASRNRSYDEQEAVLQQYAAELRDHSGTVRRRSATEAVYDSVLYFVARQVRVLPKSWDWTASRTVDGGYLNVGGFGTGGLQILSFSRGIRHGGLGVCPTRQGPQ